MGRIVGIDLGTTNSVVAIVDAGGARILRNRENEPSTRSIVGYSKGEAVVGSVALNRWPLNPRETIISIKRLMGRSANDSEIEKVRQWFTYDIVNLDNAIHVKLGGKEYTPVDISAMILKKLKEDAEYVLGEEVTHAVITVPAYFSDKQRHATREAGIQAGLKVMKILDEPTAAAIAHGIEAREQEAKTILVYDLGGGTFDISVLMMGMGAFAPLNLEGDMWLGGDNFDQAIVEHILGQIRQEYGIDPRNNYRFMAELKLQAQKAKEALSSSSFASIIISGKLQDEAGNIIDIDMDITREQFERLAKPLVEKATALVKKAVENAKLTNDEIDFVLMAGNSTTIPMVQQSMEDLFGKDKILRKIHPKHCVAMGAAMTAVIYRGIECPQCKKLNEMDAVTCESCGFSLEGVARTKTCPTCGRECDDSAEQCECGAYFLNISPDDGGCAPFSYGIQTAGDKYSVFIDKSDVYPTPEDKRVVQTFRTIYPDQPSVSIPVYGGDNLEKASANELQGLALAVLPPHSPQGTNVRIKLWLNKDGYFELNAFLDDGTDLRPTILRDRDTGAAMRIESCEAKIAEKMDYISPEDKLQIDQKKRKAYEALRENDPDRAKQLAGEIEELLEKPVTQPGVLEQAENLAAYSMYIISEYGWLIGQSAYTLNLKVEELKTALRTNDPVRIQSAMQVLENAVDALVRSNELLALFLGLHNYIISTLGSADPIRTNQLRDELKTIEKAFMNQDASAKILLDQFIEKVMKLGPVDPTRKKKCTVCGHENNFIAVQCEKCGSLLNMVAGSADARFSSTGKLL